MLHVHRGERADALVGGLAELLARPLPDPMVAEVVAVPTRGIERWLSQQLAGRLGVTPGRADGVCANVAFPFPGTLVTSALAESCGTDPRIDPWSPGRAVWPLLETVDDSIAESWLTPFATHVRLSAPPGESRRFASVRHVADLFDRYSVHRPEMVRAWAKGDDQAAADAPWQPALWRRLRERIGAPSLAERLPDACDRLKAEPTLVELPERLCLFGLTRLPASYVDVLAALAAHRDIHLFLLHPSAALWERVAALGELLPRGMSRRDDPTEALAVNPLLDSWGRDAREMQLVIAGAAAERTDAALPTVGERTTLLARLQADIRDDRDPGEVGTDERPVLDPGDRSVRVHDCHGRARQVEVLRDDICHLLADHPGLEPRDILVMCPDIETYAPLIGAVFGAGADDDHGTGPALRVRLADRSLRQTNPVLGVVALLLDLAASRMTATEVLDLAGREPVRRRFRFDDDDLERLTGWVAGSGIRWGLDSAHRAPFKLDALEAGTWHAGMSRTLLGVAMADEDERMFGGAVPLDDVDSGDIDLVGRAAELVERLAAITDMFSTAKPIGAWTEAIATAADLVCATREVDGWQRAELGRMLDGIVEESGGSPVGLTLPDVQALLAQRLQGRPTRANFRTGHLTVCTLVPMRSVPHRVVCLLGLDDGAFPRGAERDGDDLILADPHVGDRDARTEDRQLLLDALVAATDHLVITYSGRDERTNSSRPPAVPVGELLDVIDHTVRTAAGGPARGEVVVRHPLQPFDPRNFTPGRLGAAGPFSFDRVNLEGARALCAPRHGEGPFLADPLPPLDTTRIELDDLERFVRHPLKEFLRRRFSLSLGDWSTELDDALPLDIDSLEKWQVGERLLSARRAGQPEYLCVAAEAQRGVLPPGQLASAALSEIGELVELLVAACPETDGDPSSVDVNTVLADGTHLVGTVPGVHGDLLLHVTYSRLKAGLRLQSWVRLLALAAARPEREMKAVSIGKVRPGARYATRITVARVGALGADLDERRALACEQLGILVDLYRRGMCEPLPLFGATSAAWAAERRKPNSNPLVPARKQWEGNDFTEDKEAEHRLVLGGVVPFDRLLEAAPAGDEVGDGWAADEETRFGRCARRLWDSLLDHEEVSDR